MNRLNVGARSANRPPGQIRGTITNDNAKAGNVGEIISTSVLSGSAISLTTNTATDLMSMSLTAGDWDVWLETTWSGDVATTVTIIGSNTSPSSTGIGMSNALGGAACQFLAGATAFNTNLGAIAMATGPRRFSLASTTTVYGVVYATFNPGSGACSVYGILRARRVR